MNCYPFIEAEKAGRRNVSRACALLKVSRAAFYAHLAGPSQREQADAELTEQIRAVHGESKGRYGAPRVHAELRRRGRRHSRKRVARLMRTAGIAGRAARRWKKTTVADPAAAARAGRIRRDFTTDAAKLNARWCGDITYIGTWEGWLYLATVIDIASRRVVGYALADHLRTELISAALGNAVAARDPRPGVIFHAGRGCQYTSAEFAGRASDWAVTLSHGRTGQCGDNALAESFFASIKGELIDLQPWPTKAGAKRAIVGYIAWYNGTRLHSTLGYRSPAEFEETSKIKRRNGARWALALALGLRQGEALGLQWGDIDLQKGTIRIRRSRLRPRYTHGCGGTCGQAPADCPQRLSTRPAAGPVKSKAGRRTIGLPPQLLALLRTHQAEQELEQAVARQLWHEEGWVFTTPAGQPINPRADYDEWKRLLKDAGLRDSRLHDARHTAATVLLVLRQPTPTVMSLMGWSSESMAARYQHVTDALRSQVASQVGELIWDSSAGGGDEAPLMVHRGPLAVLLSAIEECIAAHRSGTGQRPELLAALAELRAVLPPARTPPETANETKTETTGPPRG